MDADVMQIRGGQYYRQIAPLVFADPFGIPSHPGCMADPFEITFKISFHLYGDAVF